MKFDDEYAVKMVRGRIRDWSAGKRLKMNVEARDIPYALDEMLEIIMRVGFLETRTRTETSVLETEEVPATALDHVKEWLGWKWLKVKHRRIDVVQQVNHFKACPHMPPEARERDYMEFHSMTMKPLERVTCEEFLTVDAETDPEPPLVLR